MLHLLLLEWKSLWRSHALPVCLLCWAVLTAAALTITVSECSTQRRASESAAAADYHRWLSQGPKYAHAAAHYGMYAFRPVFGTAMMDPGVMDYVGQSVYLEAHVQDPTVYRPADDNVSALHLGLFSPAWVCSTILPLFVIVIGFASFAGERARGTLRLSLLQSRSTMRLLAVRSLALLPLGAIPVLVTVMSAWLFAHGLHMPEPAHEASRWMVLAAVPLAGVVFWTAFTVSVSVFSRTPAASLATALTAWLLLCLVIPRAAVQYAVALAPTPTRQQLALQMREATGEGEDSRSEDLLQQRMFAAYGVTRVQDLPVSLDGIRREAAEEAGDVIFDRFWGVLFQQYEAQERALQQFAWLSPALATSLATELAAMTGVRANTAFVHQAEDHRRMIQQKLNQELSRKREASAGPRPSSGPELWTSVPAFHFRTDRWSESDTAQPPRILLALLFQLAVAGAMLVLAARRLERGTA